MNKYIEYIDRYIFITDNRVLMIVIELLFTHDTPSDVRPLLLDIEIYFLCMS